MLNYETLLSNYDDKLTLMQWLKKVEDALKDASAVSFDAVNLGNATFKFKIVFEDGSEIESDPLVINQGDSVASAAIVNGDLILTLTNGDTIDAGNMFDGNVNITGTLDVGNDVSINGGISVTGDVSAVNVSASGDVTATGDVSVGGDLPVTGTITGAEIVENMTGYTFEVNPSVASVVDCKYAGVVKNGNKLTFALLADITPTANWDIGVAKTLCFYYVPATIWSKLVPSTIGGASAVSCMRGYAFQYVNSGVAVDIYFTRGSLGQLMLVIYPEATLTANNTYTLRVELTFLLSDNLAA